jgi:pyruvate/2-oxoglutarate dehydrogenase complex dihydrolipoamide dehydrogenase (E3) component
MFCDLPRLLVKEDPDAAKVIKEQLLKVDGAQVYTNCTITQISHTKHRGYAVTFQLGSSNVPPSEQRFDALLVAAGPLYRLSWTDRSSYLNSPSC